MSRYNSPSRRRRLSLQRLDSRTLLAADFQSPYQPLDVNVDLLVNEQDVADVFSAIDLNPTEINEAMFIAGWTGYPDVTGDSLLTALDALRIINQINSDIPLVSSRLTHDSAFSGTTNHDLITNDPGFEIQASPGASVAVEINDQVLQGIDSFRSGDRISLTATTLDLLTASPLADGKHKITIRAIGSSSHVEFEMNLDRTSPNTAGSTEAPRITQDGRQIIVEFNESLASEVASIDPAEIVVRGISQAAFETFASSLSVENDSKLVIGLGEPLGNGSYEIRLPSIICDPAGNAVPEDGLQVGLNNRFTFTVDPATQFVTVSSEHPTISVFWDSIVQTAVVSSSPGPTVASRAYAMMHTAMFDAWSAYDPRAISTNLADSMQRPGSESNLANKAEAMSFAAYRVLVDLFPSEVDLFNTAMEQLEFDSEIVSHEADTAIGIGYIMADALLASRHQDGSNQLGDSLNGIPGIPYSNVTVYSGSNSTELLKSPARWTPEYVPIGVSPNDHGHDHVQQFLTPQWGEVTPFGFSDVEAFRPDPPQPFLLVNGSVDVASKEITLSNGALLPITPDLVGSVINPKFIAQAERVVDASASLTDEQKLIAEFWEDAKHTSFPPGTWMTFGHYLSARDEHSLDDDAKLFFTLSNAIFDASIATWDAKIEFDYVRPVRAIRMLGELGLIGRYDESQAGWVIDAWTPSGGTQSILATDFLTYQTPGSDPSPPFSEYTSGHSGFSAAGATVLELFSGSSDFGASLSFPIGSSRFEPGVVPRELLTLQWDTFRDAADQAGVSRIYGGIHFDEGDLRGRELGDQVGFKAWDKAQRYIFGIG